MKDNSYRMVRDVSHICGGVFNRPCSLAAVAANAGYSGSRMRLRQRRPSARALTCAALAHVTEHATVAGYCVQASSVYECVAYGATTGFTIRLTHNRYLLPRWRPRNFGLALVVSPWTWYEQYFVDQRVFEERPTPQRDIIAKKTKSKTK